VEEMPANNLFVAFRRGQGACEAPVDQTTQPPA
jgi:hypothetical protein